MTKEDIVNWAYKSGFLVDTHAQQYQPNCILSTHGLIDENLKRFATLVAAHKAEVITAEAYRGGYKDGMEAAALICDNVAGKYQHAHNASSENIAEECADAIRARGTT